MKIILLLSLISFSSLSFSSENPSIANIAQAIMVSLESRDLSCSWESDNARTFRASSLNFTFLVENKYTLTINEAEQPVITFLKLENNEESLVTITTNSDLTVVEGIKSVTSTLTKTQINVGTITNPRFEEKIVKTIKGSLECK